MARVPLNAQIVGQTSVADSLDREIVEFEPDGIAHITLRVTDLERSRHFYEEALGFAVERLADRCRFRVGDTTIVLRPILPGTPQGDRFWNASDPLTGIGEEMSTLIGDRRPFRRLPASVVRVQARGRAVAP